MSEPELRVSLPTPSDFAAFPYPRPYDIQKDLMRCLYSAIEEGKVAIIESPTGTGKTLSLLCASLTWLYDDQNRSRTGILKELRNSLSAGNEPNWVFEQTFDRMKNDLIAVEAEFEEYLRDIRNKEGERKKKERKTKRQKPSEDFELTSSSDETFLPDDSLNDLDFPKGSTHLERFCTSTVPENNRPTQTSTKQNQVYYASRTHSQLTQVSEELLKLRFSHFSADSVDKILKSDECKVPRAVALASRTHLCINDTLRNRAVDIDEACRDLMNGPATDRCTFLPPIGDEQRMTDMRDRILANPQDIEDLMSSGREARTCPYFASRAAVPLAEIVTVPYNLLLHKNSREAVGLDLTGQIVIIDEAHNLIDTILQLHTVELRASTLSLALSQLRTYLERFRVRLAATHALQLRRLIHFLTALSQYVEDLRCREESLSKIMSVTSFTEELGNKVNDINLVDLQSYLQASKVIRKISGYAKHKKEDPEAAESYSTGPQQSATMPLRLVESFLAGLTNDTEDGRVSLSQNTANEIVIKYQHLNASTHFEEVVRLARSVVLAGGTMSPISDVMMQLFPSISPDRVSIFSCGHVIPPSNLKGLIIEKGPQGKDLCFTFKRRHDEQLLTELGQVIFNLSNIVPRGLVIFLPSYAFLDTIRKLWTESGLIGRLRKKKEIFYEPLDSTSVDKVLREYSASATSQTVDERMGGAILFAVVGAKLSEGLNFADDLARAVVIVGLPFPNLMSPDLKERMRYISEQQRIKEGTGSHAGKSAGQELYENICMRAVNQSIGRAIRHQNDWASLIFVDSRYSSPRIRNKLPQWIDQSTTVMRSFGQAVREVVGFFKLKN